MEQRFDLQARRAIKMALARQAYARGEVRIANPDLTGYTWLVASHGGVFAVAEDRVGTALHGWFFGICAHESQIYLFENCGLRDRASGMGRIVRIDLRGKLLCNPQVLVTGLDANCHQIRVIDGLLCLVDTANQAIRRYTLVGDLVDIKQPFPTAPVDDRTGAYRHINSIAKVGSRIALMCHNGKALPEKASELAWLDEDWQVQALEPLDGQWCHDIVADEGGTIWHCGSRGGHVLASDGRRIAISPDMLTRGLAFSPDRAIVGLSSFGLREQRHRLAGSVAIFDRSFGRLADLELSGPPTDIALI